MNKKILLTGAGGMLATDFIKYHSKDFDIVVCDRKILDITNEGNIEDIIKAHQPDIILNCAAYTDVEGAETLGNTLPYDINTLGVQFLAKYAKKYDIDFITISTDYVFDGEKKEGYIPTDTCQPINVYGMSKYLGERLALSTYSNSIIIRTSWLYGGGMQFKNFVNTMLSLAESGDTLNIVNDQFGIPTYTKDLSQAIIQLIQNIELYRGDILHFSNSSTRPVSRFDFAQEIFTLTEVSIKLSPVKSTEFPTKAKRPQYSVLKNESDIQLRDWRVGLEEYLDNL